MNENPNNDCAIILKKSFISFERSTFVNASIQIIWICSIIKHLNLVFTQSHTIEHSAATQTHSISNPFTSLFELVGPVQLDWQLVLFPSWEPEVELFVQFCGGGGLQVEFIGGVSVGLEELDVSFTFGRFWFMQILLPELSTLHLKSFSIVQFWEHPSPLTILLSSHSSKSTLIPSPHLGVHIFVSLL